jgi:hypothetical protein
MEVVLHIPVGSVQSEQGGRKINDEIESGCRRSVMAAFAAGMLFQAAMV